MMERSWFYRLSTTGKPDVLASLVVFLAAGMVPVASLAAVLVYAGAKLMNPKMLGQLWRADRAEAGVHVATLSTVVVVDLGITGLGCVSASEGGGRRRARPLRRRHQGTISSRPLTAGNSRL